MTNVAYFTVLRLLGLTRGAWVNLCNEYQDSCCFAAAADGTDESQYWVIRSSRSWELQKIECYQKDSKSRYLVFKWGNKIMFLSFRLVSMQTKKENDCLAKYIYDEYKDDASVQYAIGNILMKTKTAFLKVSFCTGMKVSDEYPGIYEWDTENSPTSVEIWNWRPSTPTGLGCAVMNVGKTETMTGMWTDVDCSAASYYAVCEKTPTTSNGY